MFEEIGVSRLRSGKDKGMCGSSYSNPMSCCGTSQKRLSMDNATAAKMLVLSLSLLEGGDNPFLALDTAKRMSDKIQQRDTRTATISNSM